MLSLEPAVLAVGLLHVVVTWRRWHWPSQCHPDSRLDAALDFFEQFEVADADYREAFFIQSQILLATDR